MTGLVARIRSWWSGVRRGRAVDADMKEEFRLHIELRAADLERAGLPAGEALRRARVEFGGVEHYTHLAREAHGLAWFDALRFSWLDFKLGGRMIMRYPWLTVISALAIGFAIAIGAGVSGAIGTIRSASLPLDEGDRIVGLQLFDIRSQSAEYRILRDVDEWRTSVHTVVDLGAFRPALLNLIGADGHSEAIRGVEMSAAGFRVARVPPLLGRYLIDDDERPTAPEVVVLGYGVWRNRFNAERDVVGRTVRLGGSLRTVVGVMPEGFAFPVNYTMWVPLRLDPLAYERRAGPALFVFGRLARGATLDDARNELAIRAAAASQDHPATHRDLRARVLPFSQSWFRLDDPSIVRALRTVIVVVVLVVVVISVNVATLVYARTATRQREIAVRTALGATRGRIVAQLFGEACVLSGCGAALGLGIISMIAVFLERALARLGFAVAVPFWIRFDVSRSTLVWLVMLTFLGAVIIGVLPALRVTGARVQLSLQRLVGGHSGFRMGRVWTTLILSEVALAVVLLPPAVRFTGEWLRVEGTGPGFGAEQYLSAALSMEVTRSRTESGASFRSRFERARDELLARLAAEPDVVAVTYANGLPGSEDETLIEAEGVTRSELASPPPLSAAERVLQHARQGSVDRRYFETFDVPIVAGRGFGPADADSGSRVVIVNRSFVEEVFHGGNAIGRRVRTITYRSAGDPVAGPWLEIVGVVADFPAELPFPGLPRGAMYEAGEIGRSIPVTLALRLRTDPRAFASRLRRMAAAVEPELLFGQIGPLDDRMRAQYLPLQWISVSIALLSLSVLMLSCAGIYALMSVVVTQRRREIGIRVALGAAPRRVLWAIFSRASAQIGTGVVIGLVVAEAVDWGLTRGALLGEQRIPILAAVSMFMAAFATLAALTPARIALRIPPTDALKSE